MNIISPIAKGGKQSLFLIIILIGFVKQGGGLGEKYNSRSSLSDYYTPIKCLNQLQTDWKIKARVTKKYDMREWKNAKGNGYILNIELMDKDGTLIQATFFNDAAEKYKD